MSNLSRCSICAEFNGRASKENLFWTKGRHELEWPTRILYSTGRWVIMPTIGPLKEGHLLVASYEHKLSVGYCSSDEILNLEVLLGDISEVLNNTYNEQILIFEHGPVSALRKGGCCVDHAHVHILPHSSSCLKELENNFYLKNIDSLTSLRYAFNDQMPYLYYNGSEDGKYLIKSDRIPSQYLRKVIARDIDAPQIWNWRSNPRWETIDKTLRRLNKIEWAKALTHDDRR